MVLSEIFGARLPGADLRSWVADVGYKLTPRRTLGGGFPPGCGWNLGEIVSAFPTAFEVVFSHLPELKEYFTGS